MAATGFISVQKRLERWLSNESRNKCWNMSHSFLITTAHYKNCMEIINLYKLRQKSDAKVSQLKLMKTTNISKVSNTGDLSSSLFTYITKICTYIMYMYDWMDGWMDFRVIHSIRGSHIKLFVSLYSSLSHELLWTDTALQSLKPFQIPSCLLSSCSNPQRTCLYSTVRRYITWHDAFMDK